MILKGGQARGTGGVANGILHRSKGISINIHCQKGLSTLGSSRSQDWIHFILHSACNRSFVCGKGVILTCHFTSRKVASVKEQGGQIFCVNLGSIHIICLGKIGTVKPIKGHGSSLVKLQLRSRDGVFLLFIPFYFSSSCQAGKIKPAKGWRAILLLHVLYKVMCSAVGNLLVFMWVNEDDLAIGVVEVQGE